jgi:ornithine cyclodeaminase/alanine dehydrogenase-like protein (mu-crystallin family)
MSRMFDSPQVSVWGPSREKREAFRDWALESLGLDVAIPAEASDVVESASAVVLLATTDHRAEKTVITREMVTTPKLLISVNAYRRPEIDLRLIDEAPWVWTDSVAQASSPGTLFENGVRRAKLRPLAAGLEDKSLLDRRATRIVITTGAAWQEVAVAQILLELAESRGLGTELTLPTEAENTSVF